ncbi:nucleotidyl transferase AbiEii/AbiGii toxin family protein [Candidatus Uhrbacteria bacterium]|nr:nucleotidyl transferase AbiEii/AbiGii toxin family protein [Candidatus Uhrbacteria bacterium]
MHHETIEKKTRAALELLGSSRLLNDFYLAGGTGLALHLGHRLSYDLDFFSPKEFSPQSMIIKLRKAGHFALDSKDKGTVHGQFGGAKLSLLRYPYPLLFRPAQWLGIAIADPRDIGCMKLDAISSRGTRKDFIDLFFLLKTISLKDLLALFEKKYRRVSYNLAHVLKSIVYFEDARSEPEPTMLLPYSWEKIERLLEQQIKTTL